MSNRNITHIPEPTFRSNGPDNNAVLCHSTDELVVIVYSQEQARQYLESPDYHCRRPLEELPMMSDHDPIEIRGTAAGMMAEALRATHHHSDRSYTTVPPRLVAFRPSQPGEQPMDRNLLAITITADNDGLEEGVVIMFSLEQAKAYIEARPWIGSDPHRGPICRERVDGSTLPEQSPRSPITITGYAAHEIVSASMIVRRWLTPTT